MSDEEAQNGEVPAEAGGGPPVKAGEETPTEAGEGPPVETHEETPVEAGEETPVRADEKTPAEAGEEPPAQTGEEAPVETGEETPVEADEGTPEGTDEETPVEAGGGPPVKAGGGPPVKAGGGPPVKVEELTPVEVGEGTPVEAMPLEAAEAAAAEDQRRRRRLVLWALGLAVLAGLGVTLTQVKVGGGSDAKPPAVRDWESGMRLIETGKRSEGLATLEEVVASLPDGPERVRAHVRLAEVYSKLGQTESYHLNSAVRHYTAALGLAGHVEWPKDTATLDEVLFETGRCFAALGSYETAVGFYEQLDAEFPSSPLRPEARLAVGECYLAAGRYQRARQVLAEVAEAYRGEPLGQKAFFRFANSFDLQARSLRAED